MGRLASPVKEDNMVRTLTKIPILDLKPQYESLKDELKVAIDRVLESGHFIIIWVLNTRSQLGKKNYLAFLLK